MVKENQGEPEREIAESMSSTWVVGGAGAKVPAVIGGDNDDSVLQHASHLERTGNDTHAFVQSRYDPTPVAPARRSSGQGTIAQPA